jgi:HEAT repeat protein
VSDDPATDAAVRRRGLQRRRRVIAAGFTGSTDEARRALQDPDPALQAAALGAMARVGGLEVGDIERALRSPTPEVRRRATEVALAVRGPGTRSTLYRLLADALRDPDPLVVDGAAWFLGERRVRAAVGALVQVAGSHLDARCREAAVAALGAIGDPSGLLAVIAALDDRPPVRRRATVALAAFADPRAEAALQRATQDRDWQVRQAAEELVDPEA